MNPAAARTALAASPWVPAIAFSCTVVSTTTLMKSVGLAAPVRTAAARTLLDQRRQLLLTHPLAPAGQRRPIEHQPVLEELLAAQQLEVWIFDPPLAQRLVREIVHVFEDGEAGHQPRRQRRPAGIIVIDRAETLFQKSPIDCARKLHQRMPGIDDLIEPGLE